jgi:hypothetical protein
VRAPEKYFPNAFPKTAFLQRYLDRKQACWRSLADGERLVGSGASFDARLLSGHIHRLAVRVTDSRGAFTLQHLGRYGGEAGRRVEPRAGY